MQLYTYSIKDYFMKKTPLSTLAITSIILTSIINVTGCANQPSSNSVANDSNVENNNSNITTSKPTKPFRNVDYSELAYESTVSKKKVSYQCQSNKSVTVTYGFNDKGLPTYAMALLEGKQRFMPLNFQRSDHVDTTFGDDNSHRLGTDHMDIKNYHQKSILITNQGNEIIFKNCNPK